MDFGRNASLNGYGGLSAGRRRLGWTFIFRRRKVADMNDRRRAVLLALLSPALNLGVLLWLARWPRGTFHDQGGLQLTFFWFPVTLAVWILSALLSAFFASRCPRHGPNALPPDVRWINLMLILTGLCLSLLILGGL